MNSYMIILLAVLVLARSADYVLYVRLSHKLGNYAWFFGSIVLSVIYVVLSWPIVWGRRLWNGPPKEARAGSISHSVYFAIGVLDALGNVIGTIGSARVSGPLQVVLAQLIIPTNMIMSFFMLRTRYWVNHWFGVLLIITGVCIALVPALSHLSDPGSDNSVQWIMMLLVAIVPGSLSNVVKERFLKEDAVDILTFNAFTSTYQLFFGLLTAPVVFSSAIVGSRAVIRPNQFLDYCRDSVTCIVKGTNSRPGDMCEGTLGVLGVYIAFNITFNIVLLVVFRVGSATLAVMASALRVALSAFLFQWRLLSGRAYAKLTAYDGSALVVLLLGLIVYRIRDEAKKPADGADYEPVAAGPDDEIFDPGVPEGLERSEDIAFVEEENI